MELHFYVPVYAFGCRQLREPNIMGRCPSEVDDHDVAPSGAGQFLRLGRRSSTLSDDLSDQYPPPGPAPASSATTTLGRLGHHSPQPLVSFRRSKNGAVAAAALNSIACACVSYEQGGSSSRSRTRWKEQPDVPRAPTFVHGSTAWSRDSARSPANDCNQQPRRAAQNSHCWASWAHLLVCKCASWLDVP
jgi:hypothetical protein